MEEQEYLWWQKEVIYQIYPRSFKDSNGDGVGDLCGIIQQLDYLVDLGIKVVWISPIFPSPMADFGYDVSDYKGIHPLFGTMQDFDDLVVEAHNRGLKVLLDFVPNHSSNEHPWFLESRSSKENSERDWYIWKDPAQAGGPPNNWLSVFGGSAWELDEKTGQYYYHAFLKEQPDLNWRNPEVQEAMLEVLRFWLDKGVDGFRVDVMWHMIKDSNFRNNPLNPDYTEDQSPYEELLQTYTTDQPEVHEIVRMMRKVLDKYDERVLIGEIYLPVEKLVSYYGKNNQEAHLPFNFQLVLLPWKAQEIRVAINKYEGLLPPGGWPNWVLGNHDKSRIATRVGVEQARVAAMLLLTLRGTPTMYYGDEIGMQDVEIPTEMVQDPQEKNIPGKKLGRDPERTPMQWDSSEHSGFSISEPWLPLMKDYREVNVQTQENQLGSILNLYKRLINLRQQESTLHVGEYIPVNTKGNLLAYIRAYAGKKILIILNLDKFQEIFEDKINGGFKGKVILSTNLEREKEEIENKVKIQPNEGLIIRLKN